MSSPGSGPAGSGSRSDFARALAAAVTSRGTTLAHLQRRLAERGTPVSLTTLSYWRSGQRRPDGSSHPALASLESELGLVAGELRELVVPAAGTGRGTGRGAGRPLDGARHATGSDAEGESPDVRARRLLYGPTRPAPAVGLRDDSVQHVLDVDRDGRPDRLRVRCLHRATRSGVDRRVIFFVTGAGDGPPGDFVARAGGRVSATTGDAETGLYAAEFVFDRPLHRGDSVVIEYEIELGPVAEHCYELYVVRRLRHAMLWVRFHPDRVPTEVELYREVGGERTGRLVDMTGISSVHHAVSDPTGGRIGVRWDWPAR